MNRQPKWNNNVGVRPFTPDEDPRDSPTLDIAEFAGDDFKPEIYIQKALANATQDDVRAFLDSLRESKELASIDLQRNVYKNYNEFVTISKEISKLESDMLILRGLLNKLQVVSDNLRDDSSESINVGSASSVTSEPIVNRGRKPTTNNASDMQSIWKAQIQALWDGVEGAQNFVPLEPGRHIIRECSNFVEISMNTNKPKHAVHLFLLNDCLLIAVKKKRQATKDTTKIKLVADRCWSLDDVSLIDMKDTDGSKNFIKVLKHPTDQFIFQSSNAEEKKNLMNMTKRATDEMMSAKAVKHADSVINAQNNQQQLTPLIRSLSRRGRNALTSSLRNQKTSSPKISAKSPRELSFNDLREIEDLADRLDVQIATREFDQAVESIEKAKAALTNVSADATRLDSIRVKMEDRVVRLSYAISRDLTNPNVKKTQVQKCVKWLLRLGYGEQAREQFLSARTNNIRIRTKQLKFEGDIPQYINELSLVHFTLIKNTCDWYSAAFKDIKMSSGLVKWAKEEVEHYASMFQRQVYSAHNRDDKIVRRCLKYARDHCLMLREVGLDFKFLLDTLLQLDGISRAANNTVYESLSGLTEEEEDLLDSYGA
ncbi:Exocyst complex component EXO84 [Gigaspora margarita]|uniref:Exocyst complex component EXO84 n=2 Tax=Gigaspora margarita TaxID=4874 RepID=A0A8H3X8D1_GIGMA|nr:Exocyst complex component EXO84 [Gigaspora margarita]